MKRPFLAVLALASSLLVAGCGCPSNFTQCGNACIDLQTDLNNCGACGSACAAGQVCMAGHCAVTCSTGQTACGASCRDLTSDVQNCGACGNACPSGQVCSMGKCAVSCAKSLMDCGGSCRDLSTDVANCGACGMACPTGELCTSGMCVVTCQKGLTNCSGTCRDLMTDDANCGACGGACPAGQKCQSGSCGLACPPGETACGGACRDLTSDGQNCGACGNACPAGNVCVAGQCALSCQSGLTACSGTCRDLTTDAGNCGACGKACPSGQVCMASACVASCGAPLVACSGKCVDTRFDPSNCGTCGMACTAPANAAAACQSGICGLGACTAPYLNCDGNATNGCEVNPTGDVKNCGGCGNVCPVGAQVATVACTSGSCGIASCTSGYGDCNNSVSDGCETNFATSTANCGKCGNACASGQLCIGGTCVSQLGQLSGTNSINVTRGNTQNAFFADPTTGKIYWAQEYGDGGSFNTVYEFPDASSFANNSNARTFTLQTPRECDYHAALNGYMYYPQYSTNNMIKARVSDGVTVLSVPLTGAGHTNQSPYDWGGYSDIDFFTDTGGLLYVIWAAPGGGQMQVSQLDPNNLSTLASWTIPLVKQQMGYAFIVNGYVYIGSNFTNPTFTYQYNLATKSLNSSYSNSFTPVSGEYISTVEWDYGSNRVFEVSNSHHLIYPNAVH